MMYAYIKPNTFILIKRLNINLIFDKSNVYKPSLLLFIINYINNNIIN